MSNKNCPPSSKLCPQQRLPTPLPIFRPKSSKEQKKSKSSRPADAQFSTQNQVKNKKGHHVRRCPIFRPKSSGLKSKKKSSRTQVVVFRVRMICHVFTVHNAKKEDIRLGHFLASSEDKLFFVKTEDMSSKRRKYGKPKCNYINQCLGIGNKLVG